VVKFFKTFGVLEPTLCDKACHWPSRYNWNIVESGVKHHNHLRYISLDSMSLLQVQPSPLDLDGCCPIVAGCKEAPKTVQVSRSKNVGPPPLKPTMYRTRGENTNHYTTYAVCCCV